jgi:ferric-dicitrate binding protein FerR (iron transport regulator)
MECTKGNFGFVDGNSQFMATAVRNEFEAYSKLIPGWVTQIGKLKASASTRLAKARLLAAEPLHAKEVNAWEAATAAIKEHSCGAVLGDLEAAQKVGVPDWADQYAAVNAIALLYGSHSASHQFPYAQKLG